MLKALQKIAKKESFQRLVIILAVLGLLFPLGNMMQRRQEVVRAQTIEWEDSKMSNKAKVIQCAQGCNTLRYHYDSYVDICYCDEFCRAISAD